MREPKRGPSGIRGCNLRPLADASLGECFFARWPYLCYILVPGIGGQCEVNAGSHSAATASVSGSLEDGPPSANTLLKVQNLLYPAESEPVQDSDLPIRVFASLTGSDASADANATGSD